MPYTHSINTESNLIVVKSYGRITDADTAILRKNVESDPKFNRGMDKIVDLSGAAQYELTMAFIEDFAKNPILNSTSTIVVIAPSDVAFGTSRAFSVFSGDASKNIHVCRSHSEAGKILDLSNSFDYS
ncbi:MAG: hypothetical protein JKY12_06910 [Sneathiella sp.]|nr:hypothetical protein [Sneathiella sp.]